MLKYLIIIILALIIATPCLGQDFFKWRHADDKPYTDDKLVHAFGSQYLCRQIDKAMSLEFSVAATMILGVMWECKDAVMPHEKIGWLGGDGFSTWDVWADFAGCFLYVISDYVLWPDRSVKTNMSLSRNGGKLTLVMEF